ncbi:MAG: pyridoxal-phosphate dependent enzyme [Candidatus Korarchaeum sp.]|nr:pyridoxal-phosphate dependent enzyme [Candidatus Korarchaeum sp.]MDW8034991.1 pyridoxal-phosphate dependent enzyme [Candidatus Korarchaeum sp.]
MLHQITLLRDFKFPGTFFRARRLQIGHRWERIYIKWEGDNPTGTQKDRAAFMHARRAIEQGYDTVTVGTCGNFGVALAYFANMLGLRAVIYVPSSYRNGRIWEMRKYGARVVFVEGKYEDAVERSVLDAMRYGYYDSNPGSINGSLALESFKEIAYEIVEVLGSIPDIVSVPLGNGTTLAGIYQGFVEMVRAGISKRVPIMLGATTIYGNQVAETLRKGSTELISLSESDIKETKYNEPLVSLRSFDGEQALEAIRMSGGYVFEFDDEELLTLAEELMKEGIDPLPASASAIGAIKRYASELDRFKVAVAIVTGGEKV